MLGGLPDEVFLGLPRIRQGFHGACRQLRIFRGRPQHRLWVELILADQRRVDPWQLTVAGLLPNVVSNPAHDRVDGDAGVEEMREERLGERAVFAGLPIKGGALRVTRESDERPARKVAVDTREAALDDERACLLLRERSREGGVPANIRDDEVGTVVR